MDSPHTHPSHRLPPHFYRSYNISPSPPRDILFYTSSNVEPPNPNDGIVHSFSTRDPHSSLSSHPASFLLFLCLPLLSKDIIFRTGPNVGLLYLRFVASRSFSLNCSFTSMPLVPVPGSGTIRNSYTCNICTFPFSSSSVSRLRLPIPVPAASALPWTINRPARNSPIPMT